MWFLMLAQSTDVAALAGSAGWAGAGLLGLVLCWLLLWHLPAKDKQIKELIDGKDGIIRELATDHSESLKALASENSVALAQSRDDFKEWLALISNNHNSNVKALTDAIAREMMALQSAIGALNTTIRETRKD